MKAIIEGLLFLSGEDGLTLDEISKLIELDNEETKKIIKELYTDYENIDRGIQIEFLGNHFKLTTKQEHKNYYKKLTNIEENAPLSQSALETLAIIAYNGPITRVDVDDIRGVNSSYVVRKLLLKGLIEEDGRSDAPGKPRLYKVTSKFLDYFGLGSVEDLPRIEPIEQEDTEEGLFESRYKEEI
ncbi:MAG: SMC-Scp complex subunit ScpB [Bacilli bacterium]|nr:SMC-Scp complex subunit ScpB [Bacilli bacterium]